ncbi:hypothetical protein ALC56_12232 [Trachymyrmex septentrionalis]|uniref:Uncharacterized protein n=1 Tax=Trachymyrmex septentrionalis TaxID=34720 RepID=A0A195EYZ3_9HYME|nr:hypothetical protein ALC56_12232 [Trachymyrmex septentrionalis]
MNEGMASSRRWRRWWSSNRGCLQRAGGDRGTAGDRRLGEGVTVGTFLLRQPYLPSDSRAILARRRCAADAFRTLVAFLCPPLPPPSSPLSPRFLSLVLFPSRLPLRFLFSIFTPGSSGCHGGERELKSEQHRDDTTSGDATEVGKVTARVDVKCLFSRVEGVPASSPRAVLPHESVLSRRAVTSLRDSPRESQN